MRHSGVAVVGLMLWLAGLLGGCASMAEDKRGMRLEDSVQTYVKLLRWAEWPAAARYLVRVDGTPREVDVRPYAGIRVTSAAVETKTVGAGANEAEVVMQLAYYHDESSVVRTLTDVQRWWFSAEQKRWFIDGDLPAFRGPGSE